MTELEVSFTIQEGDVLKFNDVAWEVDEFPGGLKADMKPLNSQAEMICMSIDQLEERIAFSGEMHLIRSGSREVIDF